MGKLIFQVTPPWDGKTVHAAAKAGLHMSTGLLKRCKYHGQILLDGESVHTKQLLCQGQTLVFDIPEGDNSLPEPSSLPLVCAFEDEHFLIADKPAPMPSASSKTKDAPTMENLMFSHMGCPNPFVYRPVNRLDKGTSGLMLIAKTAYAQNLLQKQLHTEDFIREYLAVTDGFLPQKEGVIDLPIDKVDAASVRRQVSPTGRNARTFYRVLKEQNGRSLVRLRLDTGRTHQIRVHLSFLDCPVTGDFLYGRETALLPRRFALHSCYVRVRHPVTGEVIERESPLPPALETLLTVTEADCPPADRACTTPDGTR